MISPNNYK